MVKAGHFLLIALFSIIFLLVVVDDELRNHEAYEAAYEMTADDEPQKFQLINVNDEDFNSSAYRYFLTHRIWDAFRSNMRFNYFSDSTYCSSDNNKDSVIINEY